MKIISRLLIAAVAVLSFASCDKDASKLKFDAQKQEFQGMMVVALCVDNYHLEQYFELSENRTSICSDTVQGSMTMDLTTEGVMTLNTNLVKDVVLKIPFIDKNGEVNIAFQGGDLHRLYQRLEQAVADGDLTQQQYDEFKADITTLRDTLSITNLQTTPMDWVVNGASILTYDHERNSHYVRFANVGDAQFSNRSNLMGALRKIAPAVKKMVDEGKLDEGDKQLIMRIINFKEGDIKDAQGWALAATVNYQMYSVMTFTQATGLLDNLSRALFGSIPSNDGEDKPVENVFLMLTCDGTYGYQNWQVEN